MKASKTFHKDTLRELFRELGWIIRRSNQYRGEVAWYVLLGVFGTVLSLAGSLLSKYIIDAVTGFHTGPITGALIFYVLMQLVHIGISAITGRISTRISVRVHNRLTAEIYDRLMNARWESVCQFHSGDLLSRFNGDASTVASSVLGWLPDLITRLLQFFGTLAVILYYDPTLALLALLSAPVTLLAGRLIAGRMREHNKNMRALSSELVMFNEESFQNLQLIKSFDLTEQYSQRLRQLQNKHKRATLEYNLFSIKNSSFLSLVGTAVAVACFAWSLYRLRYGHITYGTMTLFLQLSASLSAAFSALVGLVPGAISAATSAGRIMTILDLPNEVRSQPTEQEDAFFRQAREEGVSVVAKSLSYGYAGDRIVLDQVSFRADPGQIVGIVGPSGEGKTTLLRLLLGIVQPRDGTLTATVGEVTKELSEDTRRLFSYVPQGCTMFTGTVAENLRLVKPDATDEELMQALTLACADGFIRSRELGLNTPIREQGTGFSQGQLQRLAIARALLADAPVLLLDEATSALDFETERKVLDNIMHAGLNRSCFVTTHRPGVLNVCSRVYRVSGGHITPLSAEQVRQMNNEY